MKTPAIGPVYGYPRISRYSRRLAAYSQLSRPFTVFAAWLVGFLLGLIVKANFAEIVMFSLALASAQAFGQVLNQIADVEIDNVNKPYRPIPSGRVSVREAWILSLVYALLGLMFSSMLGPLMLLMYSLILYFAAFYSLEPVRAKKRFIINIVWQAFSRGFLPPIVASIVFYNTISPGLFYLSVLAFTWVFALQSTKDFGDEQGDRMYGIKTFPVVLGRQKAIGFMKTMLCVYSILLLILVFHNSVPPQMLLMLPVAFAALRYINVRSVTENNVAWNIFYIGLGLHYLLYLL